MTPFAQDSLSILGIRVENFDSYDNAVQFIRQRISSHQRTFCIAINSEKIARANHDPRLSRVLDSAHVRICDSVGVSLASMLFYRRRMPRCTGIDLFLRLIRLSAEEGWRVFLLGASAQSNQAACRALMDRFPGLRIAGSHHGYFEDCAEVVERINESGAELLFVAMGSPRQEFWISEQMPRLNTTFCMGIGGSLDVVSGQVKRAPAFFQKTGTEWLFRLLLQPSRIPRYVPACHFALDVLKAMVRSHSPGVSK